MLTEVLGNEDALDHHTDILLGVLGALPKVVWDGARNEGGGFERDRAGVALGVVSGRLSMVFESCLVELHTGDVVRFTVAQSEVIRVKNLNVTHRVQGGARL